MFRRACLSVSIALCTVGCQKNGRDTQNVVYQPSITSKPLVALVPVIDTTQNGQYKWNLSQEFTHSISSFLEKGPLLLEATQKVDQTVQKFKENHNPFGKHFSWLKKAFTQEEFVVFLELVEHDEVLQANNKQPVDLKNSAADLNMKMRIRVFDLRTEEPHIILQELVCDSHFIPRQFTHLNFEQISWGEEDFHFSPLGLAHLDFAREIASRVEDYILLAVKRSYSTP